MKKKIYILLILSILLSCKDYLDVIPDNIATIDHVFNNRNNTEKFLFTCYNRLPRVTSTSQTIGFLAGDEFWVYPKGTGQIEKRLGGTNVWDIALGEQNINEPKCNYWDGRAGGQPLFQAIRDCNIFLENSHKPQDLDEYERVIWDAEVKVLKAYYHYFLLQLYGPIPIIDKSIDVSASTDEVRVDRQPIDDVVDFIVDLIDEAAPNLPVKVMNDVEELGRVTRPIALSIKAKVLTLAASPLFNGNADYSDFNEKAGAELFPTEFKQEKWRRAATAAREAIEIAEEAGARLFSYQDVFHNLSDSITTQMSIRQSVCQKWNAEIVWGSTEDVNGLQAICMPKLSPQNNFWEVRSLLAPTLRVAEQFYSNNGVPIEEDSSWKYDRRYKTRVAKEKECYYIKEGYETAELNFDREPRFYASLGFDGSAWYGNGRLDDKNPFYLEAKRGEFAGFKTVEDYSITGYFAKKLVNYESALTGNSMTMERYAFPIIRLTDLYLLYAEALNEAEGPSEEVYTYIDLVRNHAGLDGVISSWKTHSFFPDKPTTKEGLKEIIQKERLNELALEGHRFWDMRRWKLLEGTMNEPIRGWNIHEENTEYYYQPVILFSREFNYRDYLWPIRLSTILTNPALVQNPGW
ncbi:MAG: RagB/SusD family nutrient uptake outer membrane protein [Bacteroidales bacterium]